jgi:hypothetical protein
MNEETVQPENENDDPIRDLAREALTQFAIELAKRGELQTVGKTDEEVLAATREIAGRLAASDFGFTIDHLDPLLRQARDFVDAGKLNFAIVFTRRG